MIQNLFLALLGLAWILVVLAAFCPLRGWLRRRAEQAYNAKQLDLDQGMKRRDRP
jgi:hypothetical protein